MPRAEALDYLLGTALPQAYLEKEAELKADLDNVRFKLLPAAVYFNPTERCNLNCSYCYLPTSQRQHGEDNPGPGLGGPGTPVRLFPGTPCAVHAGPRSSFMAPNPLWPKRPCFRASRPSGTSSASAFRPTPPSSIRRPRLSWSARGSASASPWTAPPPGGGPHPAHLGRRRRL